MSTEPRTPDQHREFEIRCHPENATVYDVNFLLARLDAAREAGRRAGTERDAFKEAAADMAQHRKSEVEALRTALAALTGGVPK